MSLQELTSLYLEQNCETEYRKLVKSQNTDRCFAEVQCFLYKAHDLWLSQDTLSNHRRQWYILTFSQKDSHSRNATCWQSRDNLTDLEGFSSSFWQ